MTYLNASGTHILRRIDGELEYDDFCEPPTPDEIEAWAQQESADDLAERGAYDDVAR